MPVLLRTRIALQALSLGLLLAMPVWADHPVAPTQAADAQAGMPGLEAFVDGVLAAYMAQQKVAGAQVAVVRNGQVLLVKGYGIDRTEPSQQAVDPTRSLFRLG